jgi:hypothetical protein
MKYQIINPADGESIFAPDQVTATKVANELGQKFYYEMDSGNWPYSSIQWVWQIHGGMLSRAALADLKCTCGGAHHAGHDHGMSS